MCTKKPHHKIKIDKKSIHVDRQNLFLLRWSKLNNGGFPGIG